MYTHQLRISLGVVSMLIMLFKIILTIIIIIWMLITMMDSMNDNEHISKVKQINEFLIFITGFVFVAYLWDFFK